jgi:hypothetical protein
MRILFDQGAHSLRNAGNNAMLQVAGERLRRFWPGALMEVVTEAPHLLKLYCPDTYAAGRHEKRQRGDFLRLIPNPMLRLFIEVREKIWSRWPALTPYR